MLKCIYLNMQNNTFMVNYNNFEDLPDINAMLSSLVRLMSCYLREPSTTQIMTLLHLLKCLDNHPDLPNSPTAMVAVKQARIIWEDELNKLRPDFTTSDSGKTSSLVTIN